MIEVLFVTLAPNHASAGRRLEDAAHSDLRITLYRTAVDKVRESITKRLFSLRYARLFLDLLRTRADIIWCWGHDVAFVGSLAALLRPKLRLVWDISDVNARLLGRGPGAWLLRGIERWLLGRADLLLLTSPGFAAHHYGRLLPSERIRIIENRRSPSLRQPVLPPSDIGPLVIVFAGIFRSAAVLQLLDEVAGRMGERVRFELHGYGNRFLAPGTIERVLERCPNVVLHGPFTLDGLHEMHRRAHLVWGYTDPNENDNERWLLSNRIYDAIITGRPLLSNDDTESGRYVREHGLGITTGFTAGAVVAALERLLGNDRAEYRRLVAAMPNPATGYLDGGYARALLEVAR